MGTLPSLRLNLRVDWRSSVSLVGTVLKYLAVPLLFPLLVSLYYGADTFVFLATIGITLTVGFSLEHLESDPELGAREAFLMVAVTWLAVALLGMIPYVIAGLDSTSTLGDPVNALFESMSGFTTTGATVMGSFEFSDHSHALLIWRQLTQWLGGMGIVVLAVAILPELSVGGAQLMDAEAPGPGLEKLTPRIATTARVLWMAYFGFTVLLFLILYGLHHAGYAPEMGLYNAMAHPLTTLPTGGFSPEARSIEAFSAVVQWVIIPFMVVAGTNFALFWRAITGEYDVFARDDEFRFYAGVIASVTAITTGLLLVGHGIAPALDAIVPASIESSIRSATFQVVSIVTTTGYASVDFELWDPVAQYVLLFAMFIGGSAGSTGGAIKIVRWLVIVKSLKRELFTTVHPDAVKPVRLGGRALDERAVRGIYAFTLIYLVIFFVGTIVIMIDSARIGEVLEIREGLSAVAATLGNVGPGLGDLGPMGNYLGFPWTSKLFMIFLMWVGRLEIFPVFVLLTVAFWRS